MIRTSRLAAFRSDALAVSPRFFPEFWFHIACAAERSLIPDPVSPRLPSDPRPPPNQAMQTGYDWCQGFQAATLRGATSFGMGSWGRV